MNDDVTAERGENPVPDQGAALWGVLFIAVSLSLWAQWLGAGVLTEIRSEDGSAGLLALQLLPLATGAVCLWWRHPLALMALFPISFLPGMATLTAVEWEAMSTPASAVIAMGSFALYLLVAAGAPALRDDETLTVRRAGDRMRRDHYEATFHRYLWTRFGAMAALFALITFALFVDPSIQESLQALDDPAARRRQYLFMVVVAYFGWTIAVYTGAILPSLNWEYDRRRPALPEGQQALLDEPRRLVRRIVLWLFGVFVTTAAAVFFLL